jgi:hypothetical protein
MADVSGKFYSATKVRTGVSPSSPGVEVGETLPPVNPPGSDLNSVGLTMPSAFAVANSPLTSNGTLEVTGAGTTAQYIRGDGSLASFPSLTGYVPYTGATADVDLGTHDLTAERGTFTNNGSSDTLTVNHTSGSGYGIIVTKGGNNEALYVSKTSGSGNAMTVVGGRTSLVDLALSSVTNTAGDFLTLSGGVVHKRTAAQTLTDIGGQAALTNPVTGTGTTNYLPKFTGASTIGNSNIQDSGTLVSVGVAATFSNTLQANTTTVTNGTRSWIISPSGGSINHEFSGVIEGKIDPSSGGNSWLGATSGTTGAGAKHYFSGTGAATFASSVTASSFIKSGGTSSEFLKADGSVDSTTYVPVGRTITINGTTQDLSANRTFNVGTVTSVSGTGTVSGLTLSGTVTSSGNLTLGGTLSLTSGNVTDALGFTPYNATNPAGYITSSALSAYLPLAGGTLTGALNGTSASFTGDVQTSTRLIATNSSNSIILTPNLAGTTNRIESLNLPLEIFTSGSELKLRAGAGNAQLVLTSSGRLLIGSPPPTESTFTLDVNGGARFTNSTRVDGSFVITQTNTPQQSILLNDIATNGNTLALLSFGGRWNSTTYANGSQIRATAVGTWSSTNYGTNLAFGTVAENSTTLNTRMTITSDGYQRMASGTGGIQFNGDTAAANALDDYEEGEFTPTIFGSTTAGTASYSARNGLYTKIGRAVSFNIYVDWSGGTGSGNLRLSGLPFTASSTGVYPSVAIGEISNIALSANTIATARVQISTNEIWFGQAVVGGGGNSSLAYDAAGYFTLSGTYYV